MNKQRYMAELSRLLVFMSEEDREEAVRRCSAAFDAVGPDGEAALLEALGSPTRTAIALSRGYEPGSIPDVYSGAVADVGRAAPETAQAAEPAPVQKKAAPSAEPEDVWSDLPDFELPEVPGERTAPEAPPKEITAEAENESETEAEAVPENEPGPGLLPMTAVPEDEPGGASACVVERSMSLGLGIPLFILVFVALGIPLAALCLALALVLLAPGCAVLFGAYLVFVGALWCTGYMADAVLLFGLMFVVLAVGLLVLCLGVWLAVKLIALYIRAFGWVAGELLGRKVIAGE